MENYKIITSERRKDLILLNNDKYSYVRTRAQRRIKENGNVPITVAVPVY